MIFSLPYFSCKSFISSNFKISTLLDFLRDSFLGFYDLSLATSIFSLLIASFNFFYLFYNCIFVDKVYLIEEDFVFF